MNKHAHCKRRPHSAHSTDELAPPTNGVPENSCVAWQSFVRVGLKRATRFCLASRPGRMIGRRPGEYCLRRN